MIKLLRHFKDVSQGKTTLRVMRSHRWSKVEKEHLICFPACIVCGIKESVQVHHIFPFHYCIALGRPDLELDERNLVSLCETNSKYVEQNHHLLIGHLGDFKSCNPNVVNDAEVFQNISEDLIKESPIWRVKRANKLKLLHLMTDEDKATFTDLMNQTFPLKHN